MRFTFFFDYTYHYLLKPVLFMIDPEIVHESFTKVGEALERIDWFVGGLFRYEHPYLKKTVLGIKFDNPVGLSAGFDYDGHMAAVMRSVGFGFNTVGTVTARPYGGNTAPRLARLPKSQSLLVNKGFKSEGAHAVRARLDRKNLLQGTVGVSVGSSNLPEINTVKKAIDDYCFTFKLFAGRKYVKYFELNISCPNTAVTGTFYEAKNFERLCKAVSSLKLAQPIFVKMPSEISFADSDSLVTIAVHHGIRGFIFSNLVKDRSNKAFDKAEIENVQHLKGNFSGKPTYANSNRLIAHARKKFGKKIAIIGVGGIFTAKDAQAKFDAGADLVQLITGMIFEGPQLIGEITRGLIH